MGKKIVMGIDPGLATTGWAILSCDEVSDDLMKKELFHSKKTVGINTKFEVVNYGVIETAKGIEIGDRLSEIYEDLQGLIEKYKPVIAGVESLIFCNNAKTAISVGQARGVVLLALAKANIARYDFTPLQIKQFVTGYGRAGKLQVQECVSMLLGIDGRIQDDACDALAVAMLVEVERT